MHVGMMLSVLHGLNDVVLSATRWQNGILAAAPFSCQLRVDRFVLLCQLCVDGIALPCLLRIGGFVLVCQLCVRKMALSYQL
jgi:hypothetical protein